VRRERGPAALDRGIEDHNRHIGMGLGATEDAAVRRVIAGRGPGEGCRHH